MLKIELRTAGGNKEYTQDFISGRMFRKTIEMKAELNGGVDASALDKMVSYVVELFGKQFTLDEFYDGIESKKIMITITDCINEVAGSVSDAVGPNDTDPN